LKKYDLKLASIYISSITWRIIFYNMTIVKPFRAYRPLKEIAAKVASRPYDVLDSNEAREEVKGNPDSFLYVTKSEVDLPPDIDVHSGAVYRKAKENLESLIKKGHFFQDQKPCYYIYAQTMFGRTQYGIVGCAAVDDYLKEHELTRPDKEEDRKNHIRITNFNAEPVFFAFPDHKELNGIMDHITRNKAEYDFTTSDSIGHHLWIIDNDDIIRRIENIFKFEIPHTYVADGHHRTAAAAHVGVERKKNNSQHNGTEEYNFFMAVHFPASQLSIIDYNRVVKDLNGLSKTELLKRLEQGFVVEEKGEKEYKPQRLHNFSMYIDKKWYSLTAKPGKFDDNDPIGCLDVTILSNLLLSPVFDITDLRKSTRIDFVGGIRGLGELKKRVDSGEMSVAFALFPVSMKQLIDIADTNNIMPPKTTWFEPKLRSGLFLHCLE
jgi:uncharacterized protein (DUF1015 family)